MNIKIQYIYTHIYMCIYIHTHTHTHIYIKYNCPGSYLSIVNMNIICSGINFISQLHYLKNMGFIEFFSYSYFVVFSFKKRHQATFAGKMSRYILGRNLSQRIKKIFSLHLHESFTKIWTNRELKVQKFLILLRKR